MSNSLLAQKIDQFIADSDLAHLFTKGDKTVVVHGEAGDYPSLAKIAADAQDLVDRTKTTMATILADSAGMVVMRFDFTDSIQLEINHGKNTKFYMMKLVNTQGDILIAPEDPVDENTILVDFSEPESGTAILQLFTTLGT